MTDVVVVVVVVGPSNNSFLNFAWLSPEIIIHVSALYCTLNTVHSRRGVLVHCNLAQCKG